MYFVWAAVVAGLAQMGAAAVAPAPDGKTI
jgi:hypothetical protein